MGVSVECFTIYGLNLPWDDDLANAIDDAYEHLEDVVAVDGMGGEYIVIGKKLFASGDSRWEAMDGFTEIDVSDLESHQREVIAIVTRHIPSFVNVLSGKWKLMTFVHYS